ncbi:MAG: type II secretion system protein [Acidobacteria bacterium]|nr:type II secretion system protein [Acidobacteriota bacterium]
MERGHSSGYSLVELMVVVAIIAVLASAILPLAEITVKRSKEIELRRALRTLRTAIDKYKEAADKGLIKVEKGTYGYPPNLQVLVTGVKNAKTKGEILKFLRRIPKDPMTNSTDWGLRSYQDPPNAKRWGGQNVYDVYSRSTAIALDGTRYCDW